MPRPSLLSLHGVRIDQARVPILRNVCLTIGEAETFAVLGASPQTLTGLMEVLAGWRHPQSGTVSLDGRDVFGRPRRQLALLPGRRTVWSRAWRGTGPDLLRAVGDLLAQKPRLLLLDQPTTGLAPHDRAALLDLLDALRGRGGPAVVYATTSFAEVLAVADRAAVIGAGEIRQVGTPRDIYDRPADPGVATLSGDINLLPGRVTGLEDDLVQVRLDAGCGTEAAQPEWTPPIEPGERCVVGIRPERVALAAIPASMLGDGAMAARVEAARFRGDHVGVRLRVGSDDHGFVITSKRHPDLPPRELSPGAAVSVAWQPHDARLFRPEPHSQ